MMNRLEAAARQALEALISAQADEHREGPFEYRATVITALRKALAEQAAESDRSGCAAGSDEECTNRHCATKCPALAEQQAAEPVDGALDRTLKERDDAEDFIDALMDEVLGNNRPEWSSAYGRSDALNDVRERLAEQQAEQQAAEPVAVPQGWKLVPVEPTEEMIHAVRFAGDPDRPAIGERIVSGETAYPFVGEGVALRMCRAMLIAAPAAPTQQPLTDDAKDAKDAERYRWLKSRMMGADLDWNESGACALVFEWPRDVPIGADCDRNIDNAVEAAHGITSKEGGAA